MGLIDVVKRAQNLGPGDAQEVGLCGLKPTWVEACSADEDSGELVSWRGVPSLLESISLRAKEEERLVAELKVKPDDSLSFSFLDGLLRPYFEQVIYPSNSSPNSQLGILASPCAESGHAPDKRRASRSPFVKLLKKVAPFLGQKLLSSILRACLALKNWDSVRAMLDSGALQGNTYIQLVPIFIEHDEASLLCMWMRNVCDPRFSDLALVLKYFLKSSLRAGKSLAGVRFQWRQTALVAIKRYSAVRSTDGKDQNIGEDNDGENVDGLDHPKSRPFKENVKAKALLVSAAVDCFQPYELCLHYLLASGHDDAVLASIMSQLDNSEVLKLLRYLKKWLEKYSEQGSLCTLHARRQDYWVPSLEDVLQWVSALVDVHLMSLVLCPDYHEELRSVQGFIKALADFGHNLAPLVGVTEHLRASVVLPLLASSYGGDDHIIEYLEI